MQDKQPEALRLANDLDKPKIGTVVSFKEVAALLRTQHAELQQWKNVFGHLGTADECGNEWIRLQDSIKRKDALLRQALDALLPEACGHTEETRQTRAVAAITKELSQ